MISSSEENVEKFVNSSQKRKDKYWVMLGRRGLAQDQGLRARQASWLQVTRNLSTLLLYPLRLYVLLTGQASTTAWFQLMWNSLEFSWRLSELFGHVEYKEGRKSHENRLSSEICGTSFSSAVWKSSKHMLSTRIPLWPIQSQLGQVALRRPWKWKRYECNRSLINSGEKGFPQELKPSQRELETASLCFHFVSGSAFIHATGILRQPCPLCFRLCTKHQALFFFQIFIHNFIYEHNVLMHTLRHFKGIIWSIHAHTQTQSVSNYIHISYFLNHQLLMCIVCRILPRNVILWT